jgi:hypothetical protein
MTRMMVALTPLVVLTLAACNSARTPQPVASAAPQQEAMALPAGAGCTASIARYRAVVKSDADTGNVNQSVYAQIDGEIKRAEAACASGQDGEARALVAASKSRHGYPGGA